MYWSEKLWQNITIVLWLALGLFIPTPVLWRINDLLTVQFVRQVSTSDGEAFMLSGNCKVDSSEDQKRCRPEIVPFLSEKHQHIDSDRAAQKE